MTATLSPTTKQQFFDNNGKPADKYRIFVYSAGTSTKATTWTDSTKGTANTNPIMLDFRGECNLWVDPNVSYKYVYCAPGVDDPPTSSIWTVDNIVNSQLITLYGGVDTGSVNAYIITFAANFSAYTDGIVIYWIPANTNTSTSIINVNGLGNIAILNADGSSLSSGQIIANQATTIIYRGGSFFIVTNSISSGVFFGTLTGLTTTVIATIGYSVANNMVSLVYRNVSNATGVSNSAVMAITGVPTALLTSGVLMQGLAYGVMDNGVQQTGQFTIDTAGSQIILGLGINGTAFTAAGTKGLYKNFNMSYPLR